jgi:hypothetical protein
MNNQFNDPISIDNPTPITNQTLRWNMPQNQEFDDSHKKHVSDQITSIQPMIIEPIPSVTVDSEDNDYSETINSDNNKDEMENTDSHDDQMISVDNRYLHKDSNIKLLEVCLLLLAFKNRFLLDNTCFEALLVLIHFFLPSGNNLPTTLTKLNRVLSISDDSQLKKKQFCSTCQFVISDSMCQNVNCREFGKVSRDFDT